MEVSIDQKDLPFRDVVETWLACSIRSNEEVTEKIIKVHIKKYILSRRAGTSMYVLFHNLKSYLPVRLDNMYCIRYPNMHITTLTGKTTTGSLFLYHDIYTLKCRAARGAFLCDIMNLICERFWRGPVFTLGVLV